MPVAPMAPEMVIRSEKMQIHSHIRLDFAEPEPKHPAPHRMTGYRFPCRCRKMIHNDIRKLPENIVVHPVILIPRTFRRIKIKTGSLAKIVTVSIRDILAPGASIRNNDNDVVPGCIILHTQFCDEILLSAGQAR